LVWSEFGEPNAYEPGFDIEDVAAGRYGRHLHFWDLKERRLVQTLDLGEAGLIPLEVRWLHDPDSDQGFVGATLASNILWFKRTNGAISAEPAIEVENEELEGWPLTGGVPGLITDVDSRWMTASYISPTGSTATCGNMTSRTPAKPRLTGRLWLRGLLSQPNDAGRDLAGGPQIQLSFGRRLYVTNSLYSSWDNQFYPELRSWLLKVDCDPAGGMQVDRDFFVDFHDRPDGPARAHEVCLQGGDCTTEIFQ
jgi:methanethiol oxidase